MLKISVLERWLIENGLERNVIEVIVYTGGVLSLLAAYGIGEWVKLGYIGDFFRDFALIRGKFIHRLTGLFF